MTNEEKKKKRKLNYQVNKYVPDSTKKVSEAKKGLANQSLINSALGSAVQAPMGNMSTTPTNTGFGKTAV